MQAAVRIQWELIRIAAHRCCCPSWKAFILELRREPLSVVRAALIGPRHEEVIGLGVYSVPAGGLKGDDANLAIPLLVARRDSPTASPTRHAKRSPTEWSGQLHVRIIGQPDRRAGEGTTVVEIRGAAQLPADVYGGHGVHESAVVVRVIAFECVPDARAHIRDFKAQMGEPTPLGHAYAKTTAPGKVVGKTVVFEDSLEFYGLGSTAAAVAQVRLRSAVGACFSEQPPAEGAAAGNDATYGAAAAVAAPSARLEGGDNHTPASSLSPREKETRARGGHAGRQPLLRQFPPTVGGAECAELQAALFSNRAVPWLENEAAPPRWL